MKNFILILLCAFISMLHTTSASAQLRISVSEQEALALVKEQFEGKDVDYYLVQNSQKGVWSIFVDAEPQKGWEHDCYLINVSKAKTLDEISIASALLSDVFVANYMINHEIVDKKKVNIK